eukprot:7367951-Karenia_brevis.AAC.1
MESCSCATPLPQPFHAQLLLQSPIVIPDLDIHSWHTASQRFRAPLATETTSRTRPRQTPALTVPLLHPLDLLQPSTL